MSAIKAAIRFVMTLQRKRAVKITPFTIDYLLSVMKDLEHSPSFVAEQHQGL